ncbi:ATP synthase F1 subunit gamma [Candidatus Peregrinibacteria bacterium CG10_big_fil_rev_8_21_14_0_10_36_19]|nr:MAG: ATP synthase F1 subunit gamma [Candidatus Peregrinibacteria bacterium CG10_big_fil_rev_8_21_14_0_10_36_19]
MSGSLLEIKKKIVGVKNTRKITKAMQLVAASKMRQFQKKAVSSRKFAWDLFKILENNLSDDNQSIYTEIRESGKTLFVLYTSDKGLCGPLNNKLINGLFRSNKWNNLKEDERLLITIGKKSHSYAKNNKIPVAEHFTNIPEKLTSLDAIAVVDKILKHWQTGDVKEVVFVAPHYKNSFTFYPVIKTFLPFTNEGIRSNLHIEEDEDTHSTVDIFEDSNDSMIFTPSQELVLDKLYEQIVQALFIQSFIELKASEYSSRMMAMQSATDAADRISNDLKLTFNKARQQAITQEIAELIGASMALED